MTAEEAVARLPTLVQVIAAGWLRRNPTWFEAMDMPPTEYYQQADEDLARLAERLPIQALASAYRPMLRDRTQIVQTVYEIHGAALLSEGATRLQLHVPRNEGCRVNFDVAAEIAGHIVNADCKTRRDDFPFNLPPAEDDPDEPDRIPGYFGSRPTVDPHDAEGLGLPVERRTPGSRHKDMPESSILRASLADALAQMPESGINLAILGQVAGTLSHLERALYGAEVAYVNQDPRVPTEWTRTPTGIFGQGAVAQSFEGLSGVLWMRLWVWTGRIGRAYRLYVNPSARNPLPSDVTTTLRAVVASWTRSGDS